MVDVLSEFPDDYEVRIININIDDDGHCPTLGIVDVESYKNINGDNVETFDDVVINTLDCVLLSIDDSTYIDSIYNLNG